MKSSIIESIKSLPPLSTTIVEINRIYADDKASVKDMANVVEKDPMIVANLLKIANSPLYGFGREIKNVSQAVSLFGMGMTRSIAIGNSVRKLLNVDMQPYKITSDEFAHVSTLQASLMLKWYSKVSKQKVDKLYLASFLQEVGKILIASEVIQNDEGVAFASEIQTTNSIADVERSFVGMTTAEVTALVFEHWGFDSEFIEMIKYSDKPSAAPTEFREYATALHIVKRIVPINKPFAESSINFGLKIAQDNGYDIEMLKDIVDDMIGNI